MSRDHTADDVVAAACIRARIELSAAEIRTLEALPLQPHSRTIVDASKAELTYATTRLDARPHKPELEYLGRSLETVECRLRIVRAGVTASRPPNPRSFGTAGGHGPSCSDP